MGNTTRTRNKNWKMVKNKKKGDIKIMFITLGLIVSFNIVSIFTISFLDIRNIERGLF